MQKKDETPEKTPPNIKDMKKGSFNDSGSENSFNQQNEEVDLNLSLAVHPFVCLLHIGFKAASIFTYLFLNLITLSSVNTFITVILFLCLDFWYVKNVSGRILVGLRWWNADDLLYFENKENNTNDSKDNQTNEKKWNLKKEPLLDVEKNDQGIFDSNNWFFESYDIEHDTSNVDRSLFWYGLFISMGFWSLMLCVKVLSFDIFWGMLDFIGTSLSFINLYGYYLCKKNYELKLQRIIQNIQKHHKKIFTVIKNSFRKKK